MDGPRTEPEAYEDHWYRSMKALTERLAEGEPGGADGSPLPEAAVAEADVLTRAAHLLERLRAMPTPEP